ncbi:MULTISPECIES: hypothetical protein [Methylocaldum]|jgi:hypothetical protein|uniref:hypothetical protein n=1 Tax=Methylocaldum sp. 14B TaxID=1912213 RepID=UPI00098A691D|nr:hypothetical protein [Methylocaldum sp. 14B]
MSQSTPPDDPRQEYLPANPPRLRQRRIKLATLRDVQREMARLYRDMRNGRLDPSDGAKMTYTLATLGKLIEVGDLERRVEALELERNRNDP